MGPSAKLIIYTLLGLNVLAVIFTTLSSYVVSMSRTRIQTYEPSTSSEDLNDSKNVTYSFDDPILAQYLLEKLDIFSAVGDKEVTSTWYTSSAYGFKINNNYCKDHREHFVNHPEEIFQGQKFISNFWTIHKVRSRVIPKSAKISNLKYMQICPKNYEDKRNMT